MKHILENVKQKVPLLMKPILKNVKQKSPNFDETYPRKC